LLVTFIDAVKPLFHWLVTVYTQAACTEVVMVAAASVNSAHCAGRFSSVGQNIVFIDLYMVYSSKKLRLDASNRIQV
jgi:hypothetical protein